MQYISSMKPTSNIIQESGGEIRIGRDITTTTKQHHYINILGNHVDHQIVTVVDETPNKLNHLYHHCILHSKLFENSGMLDCTYIEFACSKCAICSLHSAANMPQKLSGFGLATVPIISLDYFELEGVNPKY